MGWILGLGNGVVFRTGSSAAWSSYWLTRYISSLAVVTDSDTQQTVTATIVGTGYDGASFEYSTDDITYTEHGTSANGVYVATGLSSYTIYYWRARLYKGTNYGNYTDSKNVVTKIPSSDTVARYVYDELSTITKDGSERIAEWADKLGSNKDLLQANDAAKPIWSVECIAFNGTSQTLATTAFTYNQPATVYAVMRRAAHEHRARYFDGGDSAAMTFFAYDPTPNTFIGAGAASVGPYASAPINEWFIVKCFFNGENSKLQVNEESSIPGTLNADDASGIMLAFNQQNLVYADCDFKELIFRSIADDLTKENSFYNYLKAKYFYTTNSDGDNRFYVPHNFTAKSKVILYVHGSSEDEDSVLTDYRKLSTIHEFLGQGWGVISALAGGNNWGNQDSLDKYNALITWAKSIVPFTDISIFAQSMGGLSGLQLFMSDSQYDKFIGIYPCCNLANMFTTSYKDAIKTAFGFADDADYATATAGHDPVLLSGALLNGRKMQLVASPDDVTVTKADNTDAFNTAFGTLANITVVAATGVHGDASHFDPARDIAFLNS